ncbi:adenylate/guanylate cyclase domain-containing protein [Methylobacterium nodulans]|uniref:Adenylate/guanylate cyclase n=1 Tax=Methylobacterium nodulans (strain LMG 21967 / CNCM I-2342 / ORS 2060) TaxID=460265 RepID=B8IUG4_METNO|nr:adenylate/guanylate cyclase domain-containing protein [Methylobacterium nodulans]ACL55209.1 adenylate/guanylate cyclase [Methylobacterium nodulans ORS 2060]
MTGAISLGRLLAELGTLRAVDASGRMRRVLRQQEDAGLAFAFRARQAAILVVSLWLLFLVPTPRDLYYLAFAALFFGLGWIPFRLRRHRRALAIKLGFILLDAVLVTLVVVLPPPAELGVDWPIQTRLRAVEYLYLLLLLGEASLSYSPLAVVWTGFSIMGAWSVAVVAVYCRPDTVRYRDVVAQLGPLSDEMALKTVFDPRYVGLTPWWTQMVLTALLTSLLACAVARARATLLARVRGEVARADLARYVSPDVADALTATAHSGFGAPRERVVAVLFADLVGFTTLAERLQPETVLALLKAFRERSCRIVFAHGGTLDKFLGDGFMATFGCLEDEPDAPHTALACALALQEEMARWNAEREAAGQPCVALSIGLHCGPVVVGTIGAQQRVEFTVVGDVVNVASRLQQATRDLGGGIVASEGCLAAAIDAGLALDGFGDSRELTLRGRSQPIRVRVWTGHPPTVPRPA